MLHHINSSRMDITWSSKRFKMRQWRCLDPCWDRWWDMRCRCRPHTQRSQAPPWQPFQRFPAALLKVSKVYFKRKILMLRSTRLLHPQLRSNVPFTQHWNASFKALAKFIGPETISNSWMKLVNYPHKEAHARCHRLGGVQLQPQGTCHRIQQKQRRRADWETAGISSTWKCKS